MYIRSVQNRPDHCTFLFLMLFSAWYCRFFLAYFSFFFYFTFFLVSNFFWSNHFFLSSLLSAILVTCVERSTLSMASCSRTDILTFLRRELSCQYGNTEKSSWRVWKKTKLLFLLEKQVLGKQHRYNSQRTYLEKNNIYCSTKRVVILYVEVCCVNGFV